MIIIYALAVKNYYEIHQPRVLEKPPRFLYEITGSKTAPIIAPSSVSVHGGSVFIASSSSGLIVLTNREGQDPQSFDITPPLFKKTTVFPHAVVGDDFGRIYVAAGGLERLLVFDDGGGFRYTFPQRLGRGGEKRKPAAILSPTAVSFINGNLFVSDVGDQSVKVFTTTGKLLRKIGGPGTKDGLFAFPNGVAVSDDGRLTYVSDSNNGRIQIFDEKGKFADSIRGPEDNRFSIPRGIAIDKLGRIHIVDMLKSRVFVFSKEHEYLFSYGGPDSDGALQYPNGIFIDRATGLIFIADRGNNRIAVWAER